MISLIKYTSVQNQIFIGINSKFFPITDANRELGLLNIFLNTEMELSGVEEQIILYVAFIGVSSKQVMERKS